MEQIIYKVINDKRSIPFNSSGTGTLSTAETVVTGIGTLFTTEMPVGSYLVDLTNDEVRRVIRVDSNTKAFLEKSFTNEFSAATPEIIGAWQAKAKEISIETSGSCELNGEAFTGILTFPKGGSGRSARPDLVSPIIVDATGTTMNIMILNH